jgi:microcystin-dependent protein
MPGVISVNFATQSEVENSPQPDDKSVSAKVLADVLGGGTFSGGFVKITGSTMSGNLNISNSNTVYTNPINTNVPVSYVINQASNAVTANAILAARVNGANSGDPFISLDIAGVQGWSVGIDNSDSDKFKIASNWANVATNTRLTIETGGNVIIGTGNSTTRLTVNPLGSSLTGGIPVGWAGGIHTFDVYANGTIGVGANGALSSYVNQDGAVVNGTVSVNGNTTVTGNLTVTGSIINTGIVPAGAVMAFAMNTAPSGWLPCNGGSYATATYPALFAAIQYTYGGSGTSFNVPDLRDRFVRGHGSTFATTFGGYQADGVINHTHSGTTGTDYPDHTHNYTYRSSTAVQSGKSTPCWFGDANRTSGGANSRHQHNFTTSSMSPAGLSETRPKNVALLYCIKI